MLRPRLLRRLLLASLLMAITAAHAGAAVRVALTPAIQFVAPGEEFDVFVEVTEAGSAFNGFTAVLQFDPAAMTPVPLAPTSLQQGCLITGGCSASCGETFHRFGAAADSVVITDLLLCDGVSLTGPGQLYHLRFRAASTPQGAQIHFRRVRFLDAGVEVPAVRATGCELGIGVTADAGTQGGGALPALRVQPNPSFGAVSLLSDGPQPGWLRGEILDLQGRLVCAIEPRWVAAHGRLEWDRRRADGSRAGAGVYWARIRRGETVLERRFVLLD